MEVCSLSQGQAASVPGHSDGWGADGVGLVNHHRDDAVLLHVGEYHPQLFLTLG